MRRIVLRVRRADLDEAYDVLLPRLRGGLHLLEHGDEAELIALGDEGELPPPGVLADAAGELLVAPPHEEDAGPDLAAALAPLRGRWEIAGRLVLRRAEHARAPAGWIDVELGGGAGFGTGAHPTTRHCLAFLLDLEPGGAFADLGCGAGALTAAAAKLGYAPVTGVELDEDVAQEARRTARRNDVTVSIVAGDLLVLDPPLVRVAVVNVSAVAVHERMATLDWPGLEALAVSGLDDPAVFDRVVAGYAGAGLLPERRIDGEGWSAALLVAGR